MQNRVWIINNENIDPRMTVGLPYLSVHYDSNTCVSALEQHVRKVRQWEMWIVSTTGLSARATTASEML